MTSGGLRDRISACTRAQKIVMLCALPPAAFMILWCAAALYRVTVMPLLPPCLLRTFTGYLCPSCGMTHSVFAVARLDLFTAIKENAIIPALVLIALLKYIELWTRVLGRPRRLVPNTAKFWWGFLAAALIYAVVRNFV